MHQAHRRVGRASFAGKEESLGFSIVALSNNAIKLQDRSFITAIRQRREPNISIAQVLPCYRMRDALEGQMEG